MTKEITRLDISNKVDISIKTLENLINRHWLDFPNPIRRDRKKYFYCEAEVLSFLSRKNIAIRGQQIKISENNIPFSKIFSGCFDSLEKQKEYLTKRIAARINQPKSYVVAVKSDWM